MAPQTIRIITDKSPVAHRHAELLAKGVQSKTSDTSYKVVIGDLTRTPNGTKRTCHSHSLLSTNLPLYHLQMQLTNKQLLKT
jgi:hypothetical protein